MSYYVTFYSYKGGVGRTLALANVAWLLANHASEPARVLVVDFDLGAPGLFQVFGMKAPKSSPGIVDYVTDYLDQASIPSISRYIHKTSHPGIDILPAGKMDHRYQKKLEAVDWKALYEGAFGYELVERLKADISSIEPQYDYVFIDSLTGYSDVGGICVKQLPDLLVLLFRLNNQNLDGIGTVYRALKEPEASGARKPVLPVLTPSWPFLDEAAGHWILKAQALFPEDKLLEISFDSGLSFGESIISKSATKLPFSPKVFEDYKTLTERIRERNASDPHTMWRTVLHSRHFYPGDRPSIAGEPSEIYLNLLKRRPHVLHYWSELTFVVSDSGLMRSPASPRPEGRTRLVEFINQQCAAGNKYALFGRSLIGRSTGGEGGEPSAMADLDSALRIDPSFFEARLSRAELAIRARNYKEGLRDLSKCLNGLSGNKNLERARLHSQIASVHLNLLDPAKALTHINSALEENPSEVYQYLIRGKALYLLGRYEAALADVRRFNKSGMGYEAALLLPSQLLAAMGRIADGLEELDGITNNSDKISIGNMAEAYLAVNPAKTLELLNAKSDSPRPKVRELLKQLARIFSGEDIESIEADISSHSSSHDSQWDCFEVIAMLWSKERAETLSQEHLALAYRAIRQWLGPEEAKHLRLRA